MQCSNPLHQYHRIPQILEQELDPHYLFLAAKYLQKSFATFDETIGLNFQGSSAFEQLCDALELGCLKMVTEAQICCPGFGPR